MNRVALKSMYYLPEDNIPFEQKYGIVYGNKKDNMFDDFAIIGTLFDFDGTYAFWVSLDINGIRDFIYDRVWRRLQEITDKLDEDHFMLNGTHTHSGPMLVTGKLFQDTAAKEDEIRYDLVDRIADCAVEIFRECEQNLKPYSTEISVAQTEGVYSNRNSLDGPCDKSTTLIKFLDDEQNLIGMWFSFATHPTCVFPANVKMSSDLIGNVRERIAEHYGCTVMHFNGAAGDSSTRLTRQRTKDPNSNYLDMIRLTNLCVEQTLAQENFQPLTIDRWEVVKATVSWEYDITQETMKRRVDDIRGRIEADPESELARVMGPALMRLEAMAARPGKHVKQDAVCKIINLGELKICNFPGELAGKFAQQLVRHDPHDYVRVLCYTVGGVGYLIEREEYYKNFETASTTIPIGIPEVLTDIVADKLKEM